MFMITNKHFQRTKVRIRQFTFIFIGFLLYACSGNTPGDKLLKAAASGDIEAVKKCLDQGADINYQSSGILSLEQTPLMKAAKNGHLDAVKFLIEKGANISKGNSGKENPITLAAKKNHSEIVLYLIEKGEKVNYRETNYGMTALHHAALNGNLELVKKLMAKGADMKIQNKEEETPFAVAVFYKNLGVAKYFLSKGANPNQLGRYKKPVIMHAAATTRRNRHILPPDVEAMVNLLLASGADINQQDMVGNTALIMAATKGRVGVMDFLIKKGADQSITNNQGATARSVFGSRAKK
ncbi:ankyrin repeat domain-containing protein [Microscilla marina]|uniref:Ankyrin domain protein n=1 Tax=Microscilla marina ATCC 23134 TaxID=313606 RepID=A1ZR52_MICM2|nr:ankyrin repeat domain-containing protein [Microscilla marina]EAY27141.1 ankyrin domain protein [Microscilla marina ATCC 23134]